MRIKRLYLGDFVRSNPLVLLSGLLAGVTVLSGAILTSTPVSADDDDASVDDVSIVVPSACTLSGTGTGTHIATINPGQYVADIGTTTLKALCNDANGFAIYATGYTGNVMEETNSNKLVGQNTAETIATGLATSGDTSNWAMKLATDPNATYPITIESAPNTSGGSAASFASYHVVPNEYTKVATRLQSTDVGTTATGSTLTTTYGTYISAGQVGDTYNGKVIYTLVHPNNTNPPVGENRIGVIYDGNGLFFDQAGTKSTNKVIYEESCEDEYGYIGDTPAILKTRNLSNDGTQNGSYSEEGGEYYEGDGVVPNSANFEGASRVKIVIRYGLTQYSALGPYIAVNGTSIEDYNASILSNNEINRSGTMTFVVDGSDVSIYMETGAAATAPGYDYGVYALVYPIYDEPTEGASYDVIQNICSFNPVTETYAETTTWNDGWYMLRDDETIWLVDETDVENYLIQNKDILLGSTINLYAYNPYKITYNGNGATAGTMNNFYTYLNTDTTDSTADLMAYNFKKTGYGFAGWSEDQNATVNSNSKIYGPNEKIAGNELTFNNNRETTLYAVWVPSAGNMQNFSCSSLGSGQVTALTDTRDNNVYTVGKMQDGNCWMMENLRLDAANSSDETKAQGFGGVFTGLADSEDTNWGTTTANSKYSTSDITGNNQAYRFPRYNNNNTNIGGTNSAGTTLIATPGVWNGACDFSNFDECSTQSDEGNNDHVQWYGYGNYYNWAAVMASTENLTSISASESADTSICPTGWSLPYGKDTGNGATSGGFSYLDVQLGGTGYSQMDNDGEEIVSNRWRSYPNNFIYAGEWLSYSAAVYRGNYGGYWSRTAGSNHWAYIVDFWYHEINPGTTNPGKEYGNSVRCLAQ